MAAEAPIAAQPLEGDATLAHTTFTPIQEQRPSPASEDQGCANNCLISTALAGILCSKKCDVGRVVADFAFFPPDLRLIVYRPRTMIYDASTSTTGNWTATRRTRPCDGRTASRGGVPAGCSRRSVGRGRRAFILLDLGQMLVYSTYTRTRRTAARCCRPMRPFLVDWMSMF